MRNNSAQCAEDEREKIYFDFRTFGAAAPHLWAPRRVPAAIIGRACGVKLTTHDSQLTTQNIRALWRREMSVACDGCRFIGTEGAETKWRFSATRGSSQ